MASRAVLGRTKAYSGLADAVKKQQTQNGSMIPQRIVDAFKLLNGNKVMPEGTMDRKISKQNQEEGKRDSIMDDGQISMLYSEYGIPMPDVMWVKSNMPLEEKKMRSILDIQRKSMNDYIKAESKRSIDSMKQVPPQKNGTGGPGMRGAPEQVNAIEQENISPFFVGDSAVVRISNQGSSAPGTLWLVDSKKKTLRPFMSESSFLNTFEDPGAAMNSVIDLSTKDLAPGGVLSGFKILNGEYGIKDDGTMNDIEFSPSQIERRYGKLSDPVTENKALSLLDGLFNEMSVSQRGSPTQDGVGGPGNLPLYNQNRDTGAEQNTSTLVRNFITGAQTWGNNEIDPGILNRVKNDVERMGLYIGALAYGGYTLGDIYADIKRQQLANSGDEDARNTVLISADMPRNEYVNTDQGRNAYAKSSTYLPPTSKIQSIDPNIFKYGVYNIPDEAFKMLVPIFDINSEEFKQAADNIKSAYHDVLLQQLQAETEQEKSIADYNFNNFKSDLQRMYGIQLSDNADEAWKQLENLGSTYSQRGIAGSGLYREDVDKYLRDVRSKNDRLRTEQLNTKEREEASYYRASASPTQIQALIAEDDAKGLPRDQWRATKWGLIPSTEVSDSMSIENLKKQFPDLSDAEIERYRSSILDENGNYRSTLYSNLQKQRAQTESEKRSFQETQVLNKSLVDEEKAYRTYTTDPDYQFTRMDDSGKSKTPEQDTPDVPMTPIYNEPKQETPQTYTTPYVDRAEVDQFVKNYLKLSGTPGITTAATVKSSGVTVPQTQKTKQNSSSTVVTPKAQSTIQSTPLVYAPAKPTVNQSIAPTQSVKPTTTTTQKSTTKTPSSSTGLFTGSIFNKIKSWF